MRAALHKTVDFSRIISMRTASNFDRQHPGESVTQHLFFDNSGGFVPSLKNLYNAGIQVVNGILCDWDKTFAAGVKPTNYIGDIFGTLGGTPDFGPGYTPAPQRKRDVQMVDGIQLPRRLVRN